MINRAELARDVGISPTTAGQWLSALEQSGIITLLEPWFSNATKSLVKTPKLHFNDSGLCAFLMGMHTFDDMLSSPLAGALWETCVFTEIRKAPDSSLTVSTGPSDLTAATSVALEGSNDLTGSVAVAAVDVAINASGTLDITVNASGNANLNVAGDLIANLSVGGTSQLSTTGGGALSVDGVSRNLIVNGSGETRLGEVEVEGDLEVESVGPLDDQLGLTGSAHVDKATATDPTVVTTDQIGDVASTFSSPTVVRESNGAVVFASMDNSVGPALSSGLTLLLDGNNTLTGVQTGDLGIQVGFDSIAALYSPSIDGGISSPVTTATAVIEVGSDGSVIAETSLNITDAFGEIIVEAGDGAGGSTPETDGAVLDFTTLVLDADDGTQLVFLLQVTAEGLNILPTSETSQLAVSRNKETVVALSIAKVRQDLNADTKSIQQIIIKPASPSVGLPPAGVALANAGWIGNR